MDEDDNGKFKPERVNKLIFHPVEVVSHYREGGGPGAVVNTACLESRVRTPLWPSSFKETKCFLPAHF